MRKKRSPQQVAARAENTFFRQYGKWLLLVLLFAFILRAAFLSEVSSSPFVAPHLFDQASYIKWSEGILEGNWEGNDKPYWQGPLYPYLLAFIFSLAGKSLLAVRLFQIAVGLALIVVIFLLTREIFGDVPALIAAFMAAFFRTFIFMESAFLTEMILAFLVCAALLATLYAGKRGTVTGWLLAGLILGFAAVARGTVLILLPIMIGWLIYAVKGSEASSRARGEKPRKGSPLAVLILALIAGAIVPIAPITIRNIVVSNEFVLLSANAGLNLFIGNHSGANGTYDLPDGIDTQADPRGEVFARRSVHHELSSSQLSRFYTSQVKNFLKREPGTFLRLLLRKVVLFFHSAEISHDDDFDFFRRKSVVMRLPLVPYGIVFPLAAAGIFLAFKRSSQRGRILLIASFLVISVLSSVLFFVALRYRIPAVPLMIPFAAFALSELWREVRLHEFAGALKTVLPVIILCIASYYPYSFVRDLVLLTRLQSHNQTALVYQELGEMDKALEEFEEAITLAPENSSLHLNKGNALLFMDESSNAENEYREAIRLNPLNANAHSNLGTIMEERGDLDAAEREYMQAIAIHPENAIAQRNLRKIRERRSQQMVE